MRHRRSPPSAEDGVALSRYLISLALDSGFAAAGVAPLSPSAQAEHVRAWLAAGAHGSLDYLERDLAVRLEPAKILDGARGVLMLADQYASRNDDAEDEPSPHAVGRVARYAQGRDYHRVMKRRMHAIADRLREEFPGSQFRSFVDTAPILERELAALAGLGWQAKNTMMIHPRLGSWLLLGGIATTLPVVPPPEQDVPTDRCGTCTRCIDACPTGAITPYRVDARRCISYLTIERRETIAPEFFDGMGSWVYGCDICQEVCPHNSPRTDALDVGSPHSAYAATRATLDLAQVLGWTESDRREAFVNSPMKRASLAMMKRNALIAAGNTLKQAPHPALRARIESLATDMHEPELVRRTALDVLSRLG